MTPSCQKHPNQPPDATGFYLYEGKPSRCRACVHEKRQAWLERKKAAPPSDGPTAAPASGKASEPAPTPARAPEAKRAAGRARTDWHWSWGPPPGGWKGPPSKSPDAWGHYKGMTDDELRYRKSRRGQTGLAFGVAWLSPEEWEAGKKYFAERAEALAKKHGL